MSIFTLTDGRLFIGGYDLSSHVSSMNLNLTSDELDTTTINSGGYRTRTGGLKDAQFSCDGYFEAGSNKPDALLGASNGSEHIISLFADNGVGNPSYFFKATQYQYNLFGAVGDLTPFSITASQSADIPVRATQMNDSDTTLTATGNGTSQQLGAVTSAQKVYAAIHIWSISGTSTPTITVKIQSDDNSSFTSATDRITFTAATAIGSQYKATAGAITDTYWRANYTITGTNPIFAIAISCGIA